MNQNPELIVMLTHHDLTVLDAYDVFRQCKDSKARYWGFKEAPLPLPEMKKLYAYMKACGKTTVLEVVAYTDDECLEGAKMAVECGCDILMGTIYSDAVNDCCKQNNMKYLPFVGTITDRPSVLRGSAEEMLSSAKACLKKGIDGFDLLGYRYVGDATQLIRQFVSNVGAPVCVAGDVNSYERLDELKQAAPWSFTIGSAFFENKFGGSFCEQIDKVCDYMRK